MSLHRYPPWTLVGDYLRAAMGLGITGGPLLMLDVSGFTTVTLGGLASLFAIFGARTAWRHGTVLEITPDSIIQRRPVHREIRWTEMTRCRLDHFAVRCEECGGWMQLRIGGAGKTIRVESTIAEFGAIAAAAANAATARELDLTDITAANFHALGLETPARQAGRNAA